MRSKRVVLSVKNIFMGKLFLNFLSFMVYKYGIIYPKTFELMYHMHALRTYQNRTYKTMIYCIEYDKTLHYRLS